MKTSKILLGLIGGLATGAVLGVLFAPNSGKKTRKKIVNKSKALKDDAKGDLNKLIEKIDHKYKSIAEEANKLVHQGKSRIENEIAKKN
ncbi:MAG: YtxH domain-containing protein [Flavobacterium sp.]